LSLSGVKSNIECVVSDDSNHTVARLQITDTTTKQVIWGLVYRYSANPKLPRRTPRVRMFRPVGGNDDVTELVLSLETPQRR